MSHNASLENLKRIGIEGVHYVKTLTSSVTTAWGVDWDETYIARDLLQNFFDANRDCLKDVIVKSHGPNVEISAPRQFSLERLFYLGSEKTAADVGQYGEGFKVAAVCLLRKHHVALINHSGDEIVCLRISDDAIAGTAAMRPILYDFFRSDQTVEGTILYLLGCTPKLAEAVTQGMNHFYHQDNPLIGELLWSNGNSEFAIHESRTTEGHVFYRNLKRGEVNGIPIVLVINKEYQTIEKKIGKDRDRNAFGAEMMGMFFNHFARHGFKYDYMEKGKRIVLEKSKNCWPHGHPFLSQIAEHIRFVKYPNSYLEDVFGDKYYARCGQSYPFSDLEVSSVEKQWKSAGKIPLPQYFCRFGVLNAVEHLRELKNKAIEESKKNQSHPPTPGEAKSIEVLSEATKEFAPEIMEIFRKRKTSYTIAQTDVLLGQLRSTRGGSSQVFLASSLFESDLAHALAVFLHEHAHIFGYDGSRGFTDALTEMLETLIRHRDQFGRFEVEWGKARAAVLEEREEKGSLNLDDNEMLEIWLAGKSLDDLREILKSLPAASLRNIMSAQKSRE